MNKNFKERTFFQQILTISLSGIIIVLFYYALHNMNIVKNLMHDVLDIFMPFIFALVIAFLMAPFVVRTQEKLSMVIKKERSARTWASIIGVLFLLLVIALFLLVLIPQIVSSAVSLVNNIQGYFKTTSVILEEIARELNLTKETIDWLMSYSNQLVEGILSFIQESVPKLMNLTYTTLSGIFSFIIGLIIAVYILIDQDSLLRQFNMVLDAFLKPSQAEYVKRVVCLSGEKFNRFVVGKLIDSLIIGILCFFAMNFLHLDYSVLISFVIGITNVIPVFGPFIGALPCSFILLIVDPMQALWFVLMIVVLQQLDGNIIGPKILGDSMGLSSFWIMFAILIGGGLFGVVGMFLGVPIFSVVYILVKELAQTKIDDKKELQMAETSQANQNK